MNRLRWGCWLILSALTYPLFVNGAEPTWIQLESNGYRIYSQVPERATLEWSDELDQFIGAATSILKINRKFLAPLRVVLLKGQREFVPFKTARPDGQIAEEEGGFFIRNESGSYMVLSLEGDRERTRRLLFHEATHWILDALPTRRPLWYEEGLAELFGTYKIEAGQVVFAQPIPEYIREYRSGSSRSLKEFFDRDKSMGSSPLDTARYYAQSWVMMHFYFVNPKGRQESADLERYLRAFEAGEDGDLVARYFGDRLKSYEKALSLYVDKERFYELRSAVRSATGAATRSVSEPIAPDLLNVLATVSIRSADKDVALKYEQELQSKYGNSADAREVASRRSLVRDKDTAAAGRLAIEALRKGSIDGLMIRLAADAMGREGSPTMTRDRQRANMYQAVISRRAANEAAYVGLLDALRTPGVYQPPDGDFVAVGVRLFPRSAPVRLRAGALNCLRGELNAALADFDAVLQLENLAESAKVEVRRRRDAALKNRCGSVDVQDLT